jgi:hypothetical protein
VKIRCCFAGPNLTLTLTDGCEGCCDFSDEFCLLFGLDCGFLILATRFVVVTFWGCFLFARLRV